MKALHGPTDRRLRVAETLVADRDARERFVSVEAIGARRGALRKYGMSRLEKVARWRLGR